jgi:thioredoxin
MAENEIIAKPIVLNDDNFYRILESSGIPVIMEFWAPWCHHCRALSPALDAMAAEMAGQVIVGQVNCDLNQQLPKKYKIEVIPTLFLIKNGEVLGSIINPKDKNALVSWARALIG